MNEKTTIIAVSGKGGDGKTSLSAAFVRLLTEQKPNAKILAIDADPAIGLSTALGVEVTQTLDDIRKGIVTSVEDGRPREAIEMLNEARQIATARMVKEAEALGADAVIGIRYASSEVMQGAAEVFGYGTAVRFLP